ncbi:hypothetical protein DQ237_17225 [Blastococcus sp. TF02-8]|uniref:aa3-type cytochrome oxidase subunit CtaJ n=1 Tax=Blastococcus sp. TF02-8 TaxID=2250574 RepID=UPI000DEAEA0C|nr:hypothetical protein [Blastococcus sp. TF02-8]RBY93538.1 hypothetical protein DQ237_17225 [Blastococcus sp. TF02-8]
MNTAEAILVFAGIPLAIVVVLALLTLKPGANRRPRYKPGQAWDHAPIWFEPHPAHAPAAGHGGETQAIGSSVYGERHGGDAAATHAVSGGQSHGGGASTAHAAQPAGPLGGARGTW